MALSSTFATDRSSARKTEYSRGTMLVGESGSLFRFSLFPGSRRGVAAGCLCLLLSLAAGCGGPGGPQGKVHGKVTYHGQPITTGSVVSFISDSGGGASGTVAADGSYQMRSMNGDQIPAGKYKVLINPPPPPELSPEEAMKASMDKDKSKGPAVDPTIPGQYRNSLKTPASYEVKAGDNEINIELQDK
jgi:hypothetical protein